MQTIDGQQATPRPSPLVGRAAWVGGVGGLAALLGLLLARALGQVAEAAAFWLPYPYPRPGSEGLMLYETVVMRHGGALYDPITPERFISGPYPPLYYWLAGQLLPPGAPGFSEGRTLSLWAALVAALALVALVAVGGGIFKEGTDETPRPSPTLLSLLTLAAGGVAAACWLVGPVVVVWATRYRADMLMIAWTALGLLAVALGTRGRAPDAPLHLLTWLAVPLFVLALYTKQTALWGPLATGVYLLLRGPRRAMLWGLALLLVGGVPFGILDAATQHGFYLKMVVYHRLPYSLPTLERLVATFWEDYALLLLVALAYAGWRLATRRVDLATCALGAALVVLPTAGVVGADSNHLLFLVFAAAWCAGAGLVEVGGPCLGVGGWRVAGRRGLLPGATLILTLLLLLGYVAQVVEPAGWYGADLRRPPPAEQEQWRKIIANLHATPGDLFFADDPGVLALAGKATAYDDPFTMTALAPAGGWDQQAFVGHLRRGDYPLVLLAGEVGSVRADVLTPEMVAAIQAGYTLRFRDVYYTYAPRPQP